MAIKCLNSIQYHKDKYNLKLQKVLHLLPYFKKLRE